MTTNDFFILFWLILDLPILFCKYENKILKNS